MFDRVTVVKQICIVLKWTPKIHWLDRYRLYTYNKISCVSYKFVLKKKNKDYIPSDNEKNRSHFFFQTVKKCFPWKDISISLWFLAVLDYQLCICMAKFSINSRNYEKWNLIWTLKKWTYLSTKDRESIPNKEENHSEPVYHIGKS